MITIYYGGDLQKQFRSNNKSCVKFMLNYPAFKYLEVFKDGVEVPHSEWRRWDERLYDHP
jgi:hypothetical protein